MGRPRRKDGSSSPPLPSNPLLHSHGCIWRGGTHLLHHNPYPCNNKGETTPPAAATSAVAPQGNPPARVVRTPPPHRDLIHRSTIGTSSIIRPAKSLSTQPSWARSHIWIQIHMNRTCMMHVRQIRRSIASMTQLERRHPRWSAHHGWEGAWLHRWRGEPPVGCQTAFN